MLGIGSPPGKVGGLHFQVFTVSMTQSFRAGLGDFRILMFSMVPPTVICASPSAVPWSPKLVAPFVIGGVGV
jgi:hypothetical protein